MRRGYTTVTFSGVREVAGEHLARVEVLDGQRDGRAVEARVALL